jgi:Mn-dependent DtxR family transcriptional regulator
MPLQTSVIENEVPERLRVTEKELTMMYEIGLNVIPTATDFVDYIASKYQVSQSGVWYTLKKLKKEGIVDFTEKGEDAKPLGLTEFGMRVIRSKIVEVDKRQYRNVIVANMSRL